MPTEFEYQFINYDKKELLKKIKELGGYHEGTYLFRVMVVIHPLNKEGTYIRVRDEGKKITMTYKYQDVNSEFEEEDEIIIDDFDSAVNILYGIGCTKKYYYEKIREIWNVENSEIVFDNVPAVPEFMEVESPDKNDLDELCKKLNLDSSMMLKKGARMMHEIFGIELPKNTDFTFSNTKKVLGKYVTKNQNQFTELMEHQKKLYNATVKK